MPLQIFTVGQSGGQVESLGMTFQNDNARRKYFLEKLREKLRDPEFRTIEGFPIGTDEDILAMSDPPYYTACPNPFLAEFVKQNGTPFNPGILIAAFGLGLVILFVWWLKCKTRTITITNKRTTVREGLISKNTSEILHSHIRNIQVIQGVFDRIFGVGTLAISSAAQSDMELSFSGLAHPEKIRSLIDEHRV